MNLSDTASRAAVSGHTIVLVDAGHDVNALVSCLERLGCPQDSARVFARAAAAGAQPEILHEVATEEARTVAAALESCSAVVRIVPDIGLRSGAFEPSPPARALIGEGAGMLAGQPAVPAPHPAAVVQRFLDAYNTGDAEAVAETFAPDAVFDHTDGAVLARGRDGVYALFASLVERVPGRTVAVVGRLAVGPWVIDHQIARDPGQPDQASVAAYLVGDRVIRRAHLMRA